MPERGLEPPRLAALGPKPSAYTNFATPAHITKIPENRHLCPPAAPSFLLLKTSGNLTLDSLANVIYNALQI